jgi:hypothetical protein
MDDLSLGYCLSAPEDVYGIEITRFFIENAQTLHRFQYAILPVWGRIGTLFGEPVPPRGKLPPHLELAMDKALLDRLWSLTISQMAQMRKQPQQVESVADQVNQERVRYPRNGQTFHELYCNELHGLMDFNKPIIDRSMKDVAGLVLSKEEIPESSFTGQ